MEDKELLNILKKVKKLFVEDNTYGMNLKTGNKYLTHGLCYFFNNLNLNILNFDCIKNKAQYDIDVTIFWWTDNYEEGRKIRLDILNDEIERLENYNK